MRIFRNLWRRLRGPAPARRPGLAHDERGVTGQEILFIVAVVGITATATLGIYEAWDKFIRKPREPSEIRKLTDENRALEAKAKDLAVRLGASEQEAATVRENLTHTQDDLWEERILRAAAEVRVANNVGATKPRTRKEESARVFDEVAKLDWEARFRSEHPEPGDLLGPTPEQIRAAELEDALKTLAGPLNNDVGSLPTDWTTDMIDELKARLPEFRDRVGALRKAADLGAARRAKTIIEEGRIKRGEKDAR
jgi:Tfp pilus assembly protein PilE